jgi:hypothetical protein
MPHERLVAVSYPVDGEITRINADVLGGDAIVAFLEQRGEAWCAARTTCDLQQADEAIQEQPQPDRPHHPHQQGVAVPVQPGVDGLQPGHRPARRQQE